MWGRTVDVITHARFQVNRFRGFGAPGGRKRPSPFDLAHRPYNSVCTNVLHCDCRVNTEQPYCAVACFCSKLFTGRMPRSGKLPVLNLVTGQKSRFSPRRATPCTDSRHSWHGRRPRGSAWLCKISPQSPQACGNAAPKYQNFHFFGKESPRSGDSLDRFRKFSGAFYI